MTSREGTPSREDTILTTMTTGVEYVQTTGPHGGVIFSAEPVTPPPPPSGGQFGVYISAGNVSGTAAFEAQVGSLPWRLDFVNESILFGSTPPDNWTISQWKGCGRKLLIGIPMIPNCAAGQGLPGFQAVAAGTYDTNIIKQTQSLVANGFGASNCMARIGWEFNGGWFPWAANGMAPAFVAAFKHIVTVMRGVIPGLPIMWNPTRGDLGVGNLASYFPGAQYVTCAALDVYETEWQQTAVTSPAEFQHMLTQSYGLAWLSDFSKQQGVQCGLGEWGLWPVGSIGTEGQQGGGDDPAWTTSMVTWIKANCTGPAIIWDNGNFCFSTGAPNSLAALKAAGV